MINTPANLLKFLNAARNLAKQGLKEKDILAFAKQEFGEVTDLVRLQINKIFKTKNQPSVGIKTKDPIFDNTVETIPFDDTGTPFNPKDPQKLYGKPKEVDTGSPFEDYRRNVLGEGENKPFDPDDVLPNYNETPGKFARRKKEGVFMEDGKTPDYEHYRAILDDAEDSRGFNVSGDENIKELEYRVKQLDEEMSYMYDQYKMGKLDPEPGSKSLARKKILEKRLEEAEDSGRSKIMSMADRDELSAFDLGTEMQTLKDGKTKSIIPENEYVEYSKDFDKEILNKQIKEGVASIMSDTSPAALEKSIEIDNLMLKYEGLSKELAEQIATEINPRKKADIIAMVEQTIKMGETGMSGDDIIQTFKNTTRTKQATGGLASIMGK